MSTVTIKIGGLSAFQVDEVSHLLTVAEESFANEETERPPWGFMEGSAVVITDVQGAIDDLRWRADWHVVEAPEHGSNGQSAARSLYRLVDRITESQRSTT